LFNIRRFNVIGEWQDKFNQGGPKALVRVSGERRKTMPKTPPVQAKQQNSDHERSRQDLIDELSSLPSIKLLAWRMETNQCLLKHSSWNRLLTLSM